MHTNLPFITFRHLPMCNQSLWEGFVCVLQLTQQIKVCRCAMRARLNGETKNQTLRNAFVHCALLMLDVRIDSMHFLSSLYHYYQSYTI